MVPIRILLKETVNETRDIGVHRSFGESRTWDDFTDWSFIPIPGKPLPIQNSISVIPPGRLWLTPCSGMYSLKVEFVRAGILSITSPHLGFRQVSQGLKNLDTVSREFHREICGCVALSGTFHLCRILHRISRSKGYVDPKVGENHSVRVGKGIQGVMVL